MNRISMTWALWIAITIGLLGYFSYLYLTDDKAVFSPGQVTHGHHQIEMQCLSCHTDPLGGGEVIQEACVTCHKDELKEADDSHPKTKFTDPRNISRVKVLDARKCVTCHTEHKPDITHTMGVTIPEDFCVKCHADVANDRPSHKDMEFSSCASAGCHNYHDNRGLYEDFLEKHISEPFLLDKATTPATSEAAEIVKVSSYPTDKYPFKSLSIKDMDAPEVHNKEKIITHEWSITAHAKAGVNCTACHEVKVANKTTWVAKPSYESCQSCHEIQSKGFTTGKHGMRLAQDLPAMTPAEALIPMKSDAHEKQLSCNSCHSSHSFSLKQASVDACMSCHDDEHSNAYKNSPHYEALQKELAGNGKENTGVSCATCHMPRKEVSQGDLKLVLTEHNQNMNLRPNEKMLRSVCMNCHGLGFSIDALADQQLIKNNFNGVPSKHIDSIDLVKKRLQERSKPKEGSK